MHDTVTFDHYQVLTRDDGSLYELGRGAMGITYKAFDTNLRVPVALKVINTATLNSEVARQRFVREARSAAKLRHRHVASVFHLGADGDTYFYAMEFIDGETVESLIKRQGPLNPILALRIVLQVARALGAAQQHGLVHRDIKPANLMLVREDDELVVKVIDFGLAKTCVPGEGEEEAATLSMGGFVGTPHFASPEQLEDGAIDLRSDIYSLGVTLWYMLAGQTPFSGSMAQVMSQHLTKQPPFERLATLSDPVSNLLRKMLAKDPAERHQTPAELRQEIDDCLGSISGTGSAAAAAAMQEEQFATILDNSQLRADTVVFEVGALVAGRYEITESLGESNTGRMFLARDREANGASVRLHLLRHDLTEDRALYTQLEREVEKLSPVEHPNLLRVYGMETVDTGTFLVLEAPNGFSLIELLRARRELPTPEVLPLLDQIGAGVDFAASSGLKRLDLALHQIYVHFPGVESPRSLLKEELTKWPPFEVRVSSLGITRDLAASETWAGGETLVGGLPSAAKSGGDAHVGYLKSLATLAYELLGGALLPLGAGATTTSRYSPLANLSERGNELVRQTLHGGSKLSGATEFARALRNSEASEVRRRDPGITSPGSTGASGASVTRPATSKGKFPMGFIGGVLSVSALATILYLSLRQPEGQPSSDGSQTGLKTALASTTTDSRDTGPRSVRPDADGGGTSGTTEVINQLEDEKPAPPPTRQQMLKTTVASAEVIEEGADWKRAIEAWLKVATQYPESEIGRVRLELLLQRLRDRPDAMTDSELELLRDVIIQAAQLDVLAAMMLLGEAMRERDPVSSFNWYSAAAAKGNAQALTQLGLMLSNGAGTEKDLAKAVICFQMAADKDDPAAKAALAECYLYGKGVPKDEAKAVVLLREASDAGNVRAMNRLGTCYHQGVGVKVDFAEAFRLYSKAAEARSGEAMGNLGVLYMNGEGVPSNPKKAFDLFQKGAEVGDSFCMYLLARCLEAGTGTKQSVPKARSWYKKAAELGYARAAEWCRENNVSFDTEAR
jgi:serine/threonine protein kinase/TPR repeat protein